MLKNLLLCSAVALALPFSAALADPVGVNQLVVFGDSLSDNGNISIVTLGLLPGSNYGEGPIPGTHVYTDGPNTNPATAGPFGLWITQFAGDLSVPVPTPFLAGGTDFAFGGATTGSGIDSVSNQVTAYIISRFFTGANPNALYTFWAGANDVYNGQNPVTAANNIDHDIQRLAGDGAKYFLWLNLPLLGDTPRGLTSGHSAALNAASVAFDNQWAADLASLQAQHIDVIGVNVYQLFLSILTNPAAYDFTNVTNPAQGLSGINPNTYLFWDNQHPTTAGDALVADLALKDLDAVPEPATTALAAIGLLTLLVVKTSTRRRILSRE